MTQSEGSWSWPFRLVGALVVSGTVIAASGDCALAQIKPDITLGSERSSVRGNVQIKGLESNRIDGGARRGANLFHSFQQFNIDEGRGAYFTNPVGIKNILSRVTGNDPSNIQGTLGVLGNADLFLINPNGIILGPNARLDLNGSFLASTASSLNFADGSQFGVVAPQASPLLIVSVPTGLQFGVSTKNVGVNTSFLNVPSGKTLALVGGNVSIDSGYLEALGGRVELGGVAGGETVGLEVDGSNLRLVFPDDVGRASVVLTNGVIDVAGAGGGSIVAGTEGGSIAINAQNLDILADSALFAGILQQSVVDAQAGDITLNATEAITIKESNIFNIVLDSIVRGKGGSLRIEAGSIFLSDALLSTTFDQGNSGDIIMKARSVDLRSTDVTTAATGKGNSGKILITAPVNASLQNSRLFTSLEPGVTGRGGDIEVNAGSVSLTDSLIDTATFGEGNAGNASLKVDDSVSLDNTSTILSIAAGQGDGGNVNIMAGGTVSFSNRSNISTAVNERAEGDGGKIHITARSLSLTGGSQLVTSTSSSGKAGKITVNTTEGITLSGVAPNFTTPQPLNVSDGNPPPVKGVKSGSIAQAQPLTQFFRNSPNDVNSDVEFSTRIPYASIKKTISDTDSDGGDYYSFKVTAAGTRAIFDIDTPKKGGASTSLALLDRDGNQLNSNSGASSSLGAGGSTPDSDDPYLRYAFSEPGTYYIQVEPLKTGTYNLQVSLEIPNAPTTSAVNNMLPSGLFANTASSGRGGNIEVNSNLLRIADGALIDARTIGKGNTTANPNDFRGGNLTIRANTFEARNGGQLRTTSEGTGRAGDITLEEGNKVDLAGKDSGLFANTTPDSTGDGGNISLTPKTVTIEDGAKITANSEGSGKGGNIELLQVDSLALDNGALISAETASNTGGNITLQLDDLLLLRRNSNISTTAGKAQERGDGGNITINTDFIIAFPNEDNDITANAFKGQGGNIGITAQGVFGLEKRKAVLGNGTNDIDASSESGVSGNVQLNTPDIDPSQGLANLPIEPVNPVIAQECQAGGGPGTSRFISSGRGGLPTTPYEPLDSSDILAEVQPPTQWESNSAGAASTSTSSKTNSSQIVEAQGWSTNEKGEVVLVAEVPKNNPSQRGCHWR